MNQKEDGRSMVEMLGVLAIIGMLSIGAIAGYTMAMNRYHANRLLELATKISASTQTVNATAKGRNEWNEAMKSVYYEFGIDGYGHDVNASTSSYETTFWVEPEGDVYIWVNRSGIQNAIKSITGDGFLAVRSN